MSHYKWCFAGKDWTEKYYVSIKDCITAAQAQIKELNLVYDSIVVLKCNPFKPSVNIHNMLEEIEDVAFAQCGESANGWKSHDPDKLNELNELKKEFDVILLKWMIKYGYLPNFCEVTDNWEEYKV